MIDRQTGQVVVTHSPKQSEISVTFGSITLEHILFVTTARPVAVRSRTPLIVTFVNLWGEERGGLTSDQLLGRGNPSI